MGCRGGGFSNASVGSKARFRFEIGRLAETAQQQVAPSRRKWEVWKTTIVQTAKGVTSKDVIGLTTLSYITCRNDRHYQTTSRRGMGTPKQRPLNTVKQHEERIIALRTVPVILKHGQK